MAQEQKQTNLLSPAHHLDRYGNLVITQGSARVFCPVQEVQSWLDSLQAEQGQRAREDCQRIADELRVVS